MQSIVQSPQAIEVLPDYQDDLARQQLILSQRSRQLQTTNFLLAVQMVSIAIMIMIKNTLLVGEEKWSFWWTLQVISWILLVFFGIISCFLKSGVRQLSMPQTLAIYVLFTIALSMVVSQYTSSQEESQERPFRVMIISECITAIALLYVYVLIADPPFTQIGMILAIFLGQALVFQSFSQFTWLHINQMIIASLIGICFAMYISYETQQQIALLDADNNYKAISLRNSVFIYYDIIYLLLQLADKVKLMLLRG